MSFETVPRHSKDVFSAKVMKVSDIATLLLLVYHQLEYNDSDKYLDELKTKVNRVFELAKTNLPQQMAEKQLSKAKLSAAQLAFLTDELKKVKEECKKCQQGSCNSHKGEFAELAYFDSKKLQDYEKTRNLAW